MEDRSWNLFGSGLSRLGFTNLNWRKGTGKSSSPADSGRDIECELIRIDVDGKEYIEKWFVECKCFIKGIPPASLDGALTWAQAEKPDVLLIIASNFLSNPAKDNLERRKVNDHPPFRIKIWERVDLEKLCTGKSRLLKRYNLIKELTYLSILHPLHIQFIKRPRFNTLNRLFEVCDALEVEERDTILQWAYVEIIRPRYRTPVTGNEKLVDLRIDEVSYQAFKETCYAIDQSGAISENLLVFLIINMSLQFWATASNNTELDLIKARHVDAINYFRNEMKMRPQEQERLKEIIARLEISLKEVESNVMRHYENYELFCEQIVQSLLIEDQTVMGID